ncbi:MAG: hypothetical protein ACYC2H_11975 [Thermoplasmatota archaeon]
MNAKLIATLAILAMAALMPTPANALRYEKTCPTEHTKADLTALVGYDTTKCGTAGKGAECDNPPCAIEECYFEVQSAKGEAPIDASAAIPSGIKDLDEVATNNVVGSVCQAIKDFELPIGNVTGVEPPAGYKCTEEEDDNGVGGTHVECEYACRAGDELAIYVEAHDVTYGTAEADGSTKCGGAEADCNVHTSKNVCTGASPTPTTAAEFEAECKGESHEAFDDPVTVACYAVGHSTLCKLVPQAPTCNDGAMSNQAIQDCFGNRPELMVDERAASLTGTIPEAPISSFVAFTFTDTQGFAIGANHLESGEVTCWTGPFALS